MLQAAASVWGRGASDGYVRVARDGEWARRRRGARDGYGARLGRNGCAGDARDAAAAIYSLANGGGKQRAGRDGAPRGYARAPESSKAGGGLGGAMVGSARGRGPILRRLARRRGGVDLFDVITR
jgi:hypothetical protein